MPKREEENQQAASDRPSNFDLRESDYYREDVNSRASIASSVTEEKAESTSECAEQKSVQDKALLRREQHRAIDRRRHQSMSRSYRKMEAILQRDGVDYRPDYASIIQAATRHLQEVLAQLEKAQEDNQTLHAKAASLKGIVEHMQKCDAKKQNVNAIIEKKRRPSFGSSGYPVDRDGYTFSKSSASQNGQSGPSEYGAPRQFSLHRSQRYPVDTRGSRKVDGMQRGYLEGDYAHSWETSASRSGPYHDMSATSSSEAASENLKRDHIRDYLPRRAASSPGHSQMSVYPYQGQQRPMYITPEQLNWTQQQFPKSSAAMTPVTLSQESNYRVGRSVVGLSNQNHWQPSTSLSPRPFAQFSSRNPHPTKSFVQDGGGNRPYAGSHKSGVGPLLLDGAQAWAPSTTQYQQDPYHSVANPHSGGITLGYGPQHTLASFAAGRAGPSSNYDALALSRAQASSVHHDNLERGRRFSTAKSSEEVPRRQAIWRNHNDRAGEWHRSEVPMGHYYHATSVPPPHLGAGTAPAPQRTPYVDSSGVYRGRGQLLNGSVQRSFPSNSAYWDAEQQTAIASGPFHQPRDLAPPPYRHPRSGDIQRDILASEPASGDLSPNS